MPWNYRIFHTRYQDGAGQQDDHFTIREAHYDTAGQLVALSTHGATLGGTTRTALLEDYAQMHEAFTRPVLTPADIPGYVYGDTEVALCESAD